MKTLHVMESTKAFLGMIGYFQSCSKIMKTWHQRLKKLCINGGLDFPGPFH